MYLGLLPLLLAAGCSTVPPNLQLPPAWTARALPGSHHGLSGLARDPQGQLWAVPEREPVLFPVDPQAGTVGVPVPIRGAPAGSDLEGLVWADSRTLYFGTESESAEGPDRILRGLLDAGVVQVVEVIEVPFEVRSDPNRGVEAIGVAGDRLVVASEQAIEEDGVRWAPWAARPLAGGAWVTGRLRLSTAEGRISDLTAEGDRVWAIERHFGVGRILAFQLPAAGGPVTSEVAVDLAQALGPDLPNPEGLVRHDRGWWVLTDNQGRRVDGPTWLIDVPDAG